MTLSIRWGRPAASWLLLAALLLCAAMYAPGLRGGWFFDDYPNIVENSDVQPSRLDGESLARAAWSAPNSGLRRPLASLSFAANYLVDGMQPFGWKAFNLFIHLLNGALLFLLLRRVLALGGFDDAYRRDLAAVLICTAWLLLPINTTPVLYVVQRMESLANLFVLAGLIGYLEGRRRLQAGARRGGLLLCAGSLAVPAVLGALAKESAVQLPLYALLIEVFLLHWRSAPATTVAPRPARDRLLIALFVVLLLLPALTGLALLLPWLLRPVIWEARDFTLVTRLLSEARIVLEYGIWTLFPTPSALSFYHDDFLPSRGLLSPWTTLASLIGIAALLLLALILRRRAPLTALGISLFFAAHLLTGTIVPLELIYEHRNYFSSAALLLAVIPPLLTPQAGRFALARNILLALLLVWWGGLTAHTARAWGNPLHLAEEYALRAPDSPRAQFELGRHLLAEANYAPDSPLSQRAFAVLDRAGQLPRASLLPEQLLIVTHAVAKQPLAPVWWERMAAKLRAQPPDVQDIGALGLLERCMRASDCALPRERMDELFAIAMGYPRRSSDLLVIHADYAWNILQDYELAQRSAAEAVALVPREPTYRVTLVQIQIARGQREQAARGIEELAALSINGNLDRELAELRALLAAH